MDLASVAEEKHPRLIFCAFCALTPPIWFRAQDHERCLSSGRPCFAQLKTPQSRIGASVVRDDCFKKRYDFGKQSSSSTSKGADIHVCTFLMFICLHHAARFCTNFSTLTLQHARPAPSTRLASSSIRQSSSHAVCVITLTFLGTH